MTVESLFTAKLKSAISQCRDLGYHPNRFEQMLDEMGGVAVAKKLIKSAELQTGSKKIATLGRHDLTVESVMLEKQFASLFSSAELAAAAWRLKELKSP